MIVANSQLIPEFQYWFSMFARTSIVNRYEIPIPVEVDPSFIPKGTVVELLCNDDFPYDEYTYLYKNEERVQCWPTLTAQRLNIYPGSQYLVTATEAEGGTNIFNLQPDDFLMLDALLAYRHDSTSVIIMDATSIEVITDGTSSYEIIVDSTSASIVTDATSGIVTVYANLDVLSTPLSKEIYLYLMFQIYDDWELYDTSEIISDCSLLATCFELKLIDDYFLYMTDRDVRFDIDCDEEEA